MTICKPCVAWSLLMPLSALMEAAPGPQADANDCSDGIIMQGHKTTKTLSLLKILIFSSTSFFCNTFYLEYLHNWVFWCPLNFLPMARIMLALLWSWPCLIWQNQTLTSTPHPKSQTHSSFISVHVSSVSQLLRPKPLIHCFLLSSISNPSVNLSHSTAKISHSLTISLHFQHYPHSLSLHCLSTVALTKLLYGLLPFPSSSFLVHSKQDPKPFCILQDPTWSRYPHLYSTISLTLSPPPSFSPTLPPCFSCTVLTVSPICQAIPASGPLHLCPSAWEVFPQIHAWPDISLH